MNVVNKLTGFVGRPDVPFKYRALAAVGFDTRDRRKQPKKQWQSSVARKAQQARRQKEEEEKAAAREERAENRRRLRQQALKQRAREDEEDLKDREHARLLQLEEMRRGGRGPSQHPPSIYDQARSAYQPTYRSSSRPPQEHYQPPTYAHSGYNGPPIIINNGVPSASGGHAAPGPYGSAGQHWPAPNPFHAPPHPQAYPYQYAGEERRGRSTSSKPATAASRSPSPLRNQSRPVRSESVVRDWKSIFTHVRKGGFLPVKVTEDSYHIPRSMENVKVSLGGSPVSSRATSASSASTGRNSSTAPSHMSVPTRASSFNRSPSRSRSPNARGSSSDGRYKPVRSEPLVRGHSRV